MTTNDGQTAALNHPEVRDRLFNQLTMIQ